MIQAPERGVSSGGQVEQAGVFSFRQHRAFALVSLFFLSALVLWFYLDHSWPSHDAADHIRVAEEYKALLLHPKFWKIDWLSKFLTVNYNYPPAVHIFNGLLKAALGSGLWVDKLSLCFFAALLNVSTYALSLLLFRSRLPAVLSVIFLNCYCLTAFLSHITMLDFPHLSLYSLAMLSLVWFNERPGFKRALWLGLALGLDAMSKQIAAFYLVFPGLFLLSSSLLRRQFGQSRQLLVAGLLAASIFALWPLPNLGSIFGYMGRNSASIGSSDMLFDVFIPHLSGYLASLPEMMSPFLLSVAILSIVCARPVYGRMALPVCSAAGGLILMSLLPFQLPEPRYIVPVLLVPALFSGYQLSRWYEQSRRFRAAVPGIVGLALLQFVVFNFTPYPIPISLPKNVSLLLFPGSGLGENDSFRFPTAAGDPFRQSYIVDTIESAERGRPCYLNVVPNTTEINVHTYELIARLKGSQVRATTFRLWTPLGDSVSFSDKSMDYFDWFLSKTGDQGLRLRDAASREASKKIVEVLGDCSRFQLYAQSPLPDGSLLKLYRRLPKARNP